jgi:hypothetical protein
VAEFCTAVLSKWDEPEIDQRMISRGAE